MGADLNIEEFLLLKRVIFASRELKNFYDNLENVRLDHLANWFEKLHDFPHLQGNLQAINEAGFIENFASEELARIRRKIHDSESQVRDVLQDLLKQKAQMLTEGIMLVEMVARFFLSKTPIVIRLPVWFMIFLPVGTLSISNRVKWSS